MTEETLRTCPRPVVVRPAPSLEPPPLDDQTVRDLYDDSRARRRPRTMPTYIQGSLAVDFQQPREDPQFGPQATARADLPDPVAWTHQLLHVILECVAGSRAPGQLTRWVSPSVHARIARRHRVAHRRGGAVHHPQVRRVRTCEPDDGVIEASAVVTLQGRVRAVALRFNGADGRWMLTELIIG